MRARILITEPIGSPGLALLEAACDCIVPWRESGAAPFDLVREHLPAADAVIVRLFPVGREEIARAPRLRVIAKHGAGVDSIDREAATGRGIVVVSAPGANSNAVAEHAIALMLAAARSLVSGHEAVASGRACRREEFEGIELAGRTLGIVGLGRIGSRVARQARLGLGMRVVAYDPYIDRAPHAGLVEFRDRLEDLLRECDVLTLHVPLTGETRHMIDAAAIARLPAHCRIVNTSRGAVIDTAALAAALREGRLGGAALDVFETEPLPGDHPLRSAPRLTLSPHIAGLTAEAMDATSRVTAAGVLDALAGRRPEYLVNPEVWPA